MISIPVRKAEIEPLGDDGSFRVTVEAPGGYSNSANAIYKLITKDVPLEFTLKRPEEEKTRKQMGTLWTAIREIANATGRTVDETYKDMIRKYGRFQWMIVERDQAASIVEWYKQTEGICDAEIRGLVDGSPGRIWMVIYWGCSTYTKEEMSVLLNGVMEEYDEIFE